MIPKEPTQSEIRALLDELRSDNALGLKQTDNQNEYLQYLDSKEWKKTKRRILKRDSNVCARCGGRGTTVHHLNYEGKTDDDLATVCNPCHKVIHFDDSGKKRSSEEWEATLKQCPDPFDFPEPKIDLRRHSFDDTPPQWPRMTDAQRKNWRDRQAELGKRKKDDLAKKKQKKICT